MGATPSQKINAASISIKPLDNLPITKEFFNGDDYTASDNNQYKGYTPVVIGSISSNASDENYVDDETWEALVYDAYYDIDAYVNKAMTVLGMFHNKPNFSNLPVITVDHMMRAIAAKIEQNLYTKPSNAEIRVTLTQNSGGRTTNEPARENFNPSDMLNQKVQEYINGSQIFEVVADSFQAIILDKNEYYTKDEVDALFKAEKLPIEQLYTLDINWVPTNDGDGVNKKFVKGLTDDLQKQINALIVGDVELQTNHVQIIKPSTETITGAPVEQNGANEEFVVSIKSNKENLKFVDGTLPKNVDISTKNTTLLGGLAIRTSDDTGGTHTFEFDKKGIHSENDITAPGSVKTSTLEWLNGNGASLETVNIDPIDGVVKTSQGIAIHRFENVQVSEDITAGEGIILGGVRRTTWPEGGGGVLPGVKKSSELVDDSIALPTDGINTWKGDIDKNKTDIATGKQSIAKNTIDIANNVLSLQDKLDTATANIEYAKKLNYDSDEANPSKLNLFATGALGNDEIRVQYDSTPLYNFKRDGIEMLNAQIDKVAKATKDTHLINLGEAKIEIANAGVGVIKTLYENTSLTKLETTDDVVPNIKQEYYTYTPDVTHQFNTIGSSANTVSVAAIGDVMPSKDIKGNDLFFTLGFPDQAKIEQGVIPAKDKPKALVVIKPEVVELNVWKPIDAISKVVQRDAANGDKEYVAIRYIYSFEYAILDNTIDNVYELQLTNRIIVRKETQASSTAPVVETVKEIYFTDSNVEVLKTQHLDMVTVDLSDYYTKSEINGELNKKQNIKKTFNDGTETEIINNNVDKDHTQIGFKLTLADGSFQEVLISDNGTPGDIRFWTYGQDKDGNYKHFEVSEPGDLTTKRYVDANFRKLAKELGLPETKTMKLFPIEGDE